MTSQQADAAVQEAVSQLQEAAAAKKCWACGCLHNSLATIERTFPAGQRTTELDAVLRAVHERVTPVRYECLGCEVCFPALGLNALGGGDSELPEHACPTEAGTPREGWPPRPGAYTVLRYQAPVAVCTLTDEGLGAAVAREASPEVAITGTLQTENLGIERLILNVLANPNIRFVVVCGPDSRQAIGHLPGQSLVALARSGLDEGGRIIGAKGKRPVIRNLDREPVEHFRRTVEVVDLVGTESIPAILEAVARCGERNPGSAPPYKGATGVMPFAGYAPTRMIPDPAGYFVVYVDPGRGVLSLEHYKQDGVLDAIIEGRTAIEVYAPAIEEGLLSRLDHAAYLGRELARAEYALSTGKPYVQDAAPERPQPGGLSASCGPSCGPSCGEEVQRDVRLSVL